MKIIQNKPPYEIITPDRPIHQRSFDGVHVLVYRVYNDRYDIHEHTTGVYLTKASRLKYVDQAMKELMNQLDKTPEEFFDLVEESKLKHDIINPLLTD